MIVRFTRKELTANESFTLALITGSSRFCGQSAQQQQNELRQIIGWQLGCRFRSVLLFSLALSSEAGFPTCTVRETVAFGISDNEYVNGRTNVAHELQRTC